MERAIIKTLTYADIFDYPLLAYEIHKWLISKKASLRQVEKALDRLNIKGYYFLPGRQNIVRKRYLREKQSKKFLNKAKFASWFLKFIPTLKLIGISGGLALNNADKNDDIDLFLITAKNRLWITRLLVILILDFWGMRRKVKMSKDEASGKLCPNILLEEDQLEQKNKDLFTAHEVLQMKVIWQRGNIYKKYLEDNNWAFKFLPNWSTYV